MSDSQAGREEEILVIQSIYCDPYNTFKAVDDTHYIFRSVPVILSLVLPLSYPDPSHLIELSIDSDGLGISKLQIFQLRLRLESIVQSKPGELVLFDLTEETREFTEGLRDDVRVSLEEEKEEEEVVDDIYHHINDSRITSQTTLFSHMGSTTLDSIMNKLPPTTKLLHAEPVLRHDLRANFLNMRRKIQQDATQKISDRRKKDAAWDSIGQEEIVFHGTLRCNVGSIVKSGFVVPGQKTRDGSDVGVRCGSTWGMGIYTSPDPEYSLNYADYTDGKYKGHQRLLPGQKLIVCSVLMGRRRVMSETRRSNPMAENGYDSHVSPNQLEYIVFNPAQVLPLYVLHLGDASKGKDPEAIVAPSTQFEGNLTEYARKHLPDGFGAASGHRFVVLEIAPVDDDEELWGDYQHDEEDPAAQKGEFQAERWDYWSSYRHQG